MKKNVEYTTIRITKEVSDVISKIAVEDGKYKWRIIKDAMDLYLKEKKEKSKDKEKS